MIPYIINVALILAGCLIFYKLLLRKETFYRINRYVLVLCLLISFSLPLLSVPQQWSFRKTETVAVAEQKKPVIKATVPEQTTVSPAP
ncbi:MAG TPA: hypothetical protein VGO58_01740, partial [Chitinophagaceae bacterium]|nr:hypothetical protein [Chitinophagaceae bacterium]